MSLDKAIILARAMRKVLDEHLDTSTLGLTAGDWQDIALEVLAEEGVSVAEPAHQPPPPAPADPLSERDFMALAAQWYRDMENVRLHGSRGFRHAADAADYYRGQLGTYYDPYAAQTRRPRDIYRP